MSKIRTKKQFFYDKYVNSTIMVDSFLLKFYWFLNSNSQEIIVGTFSYKAHFRPQISSNVSMEEEDDLLHYSSNPIEEENIWDVSLGRRQDELEFSEDLGSWFTVDNDSN